MSGRLEVITGCMFSGKSEELLIRLRRHQIAQKKIKLFKPAIDDRYSDDYVISHNGTKMEAEKIKGVKPIYDSIFAYHVVGIDEVQFFNPDNVFNAIQHLVNAGKILIVSGLDMTFRKEPFEPLPRLLAVAAKVDKLTAICNVCGNDAMYTQRLIDGKPAPFDGPTIQVGGMESYEARCSECFGK